MSTEKNEFEIIVDEKEGCLPPANCWLWNLMDKNSELWHERLQIDTERYQILSDKNSWSFHACQANGSHFVCKVHKVLAQHMGQATLVKMLLNASYDKNLFDTLRWMINYLMEKEDAQT